ncbi:MAG: cation-translocating P-type ATPase [Phycisphaerales bacterium]|nr:cation-translocating P-type ATPase [Phycisphaerales bacterium]
MSQAGSPSAAQPHDHSHDHSGHDHSHGHGPGHKHQHIHDASCCEMHSTNSSEGSIVFALVGGAMVLTTVIAGLFGLDEEIRVIPAAIGAVLLWIPLLMAAGREIKRGRPSSSVLVALAIGAALATGKYAVAGGLAFILFLMDAVLRRTAWGAHRAIEQLVGLTPDTARVVIDDVEREIDLDKLEVGTIIRVRAGENFPADGRVATGRTTINQASLTGESAPVEVESGSMVYAGTTNLTGVIDVEVTRVGQDTTIGKVVNLINEAEQSKTPRQQIIELVASHYVWIVLFVALAVFILSNTPGDVTGSQTAIEKAISVLVVTCPGALLLASPTAMVAAFAAAARLGIMIKSTTVFDTAAGIDTVVLDKTGTITTGHFAVSRLAPSEGVDGADLLTAAATAEQHSNHPLAAAILETARAARITPPREGQAEEVHGLGVKVTQGSETLYVGRAKWLQRIDASVGEQIAAVEGRIEGMTGVHVMRNGKYLGAVGLEDKVRQQAPGAVARLRELGVRLVCMFTGDRLPVAKRVGQVVGIDHIEAECHPEEKHARIVELTRSGRRVMMVGDGINDGPSLAAADVGVAMGLGGTDIAANSAGIALMNDDLDRLPFLLELARKTRMVITQNIIASIVIAIIGITLAASGQLGGSMIFWAAVYHSFGDVFVIANSFRLVRYGEEHDRHEPIAASTGFGHYTVQPAGA